MLYIIQGKIKKGNKELYWVLCDPILIVAHLFIFDDVLVIPLTVMFESWPTKFYLSASDSIMKLDWKSESSTARELFEHFLSDHMLQLRL